MKPFSIIKPVVAGCLLLSAMQVWPQSSSSSSGSLDSLFTTMTLRREAFTPSKVAVDSTLSASPNRDVYIESRSGNVASVQSRSQGAGKEKTEAELETYFRETLGLQGNNLRAAVQATLHANALVKQWLQAIRQAEYPEYRELQLAIAADQVRLQQLAFEARLADIRSGTTPPPQSPLAFLFDWSAPAQQADVIQAFTRTMSNQQSK